LLPLGELDPGLREPDTPLHIGDFASGAARQRNWALMQCGSRRPRTTRISYWRWVLPRRRRLVWARRRHGV